MNVEYPLFEQAAEVLGYITDDAVRLEAAMALRDARAGKPTRAFTATLRNMQRRSTNSKDRLCVDVVRAAVNEQAWRHRRSTWASLFDTCVALFESDLTFNVKETS